MKPSRVVSLRALLTIPFILLIAATVGITNYLAFRNSTSAVSDISDQVLSEATDRVTQNLDTFLARPHLINQLNAQALQQGIVDVQDRDELLRFLYQQGRQYHDQGIQIGTIAYGLPDTNYYGANGSEDYVVYADSTTNHSIIRFAPDALGYPTSHILSERANYDPTSRPWYQAALTHYRPTWNINASVTSPTRIDADAVMPYYDANGELQGVLATSISLGQISDFLKGIRVSEHGQIFIIERNNWMVASSVEETLDPAASMTIQELGRLPATESTNPIVRHTTEYLARAGIDPIEITTSDQYRFEINGDPHLIQVTPYSDGRGLDWLIVVAVPEQDFLGRISEGNRTTVIAIVAALMIALVVAVATAQSIVKPILDLNMAAKNLAGGHWKQPVEVTRRGELGELASSFNSMMLDLANREERLRALVSKMAQIQDEERRLIGLELHDGLMQLIISANMHLNALAALVSANLSASALQELDVSRRLIKQSIDEARRVVAELRPTVIEDFGLQEGLRRYATDICEARRWQSEIITRIEGLDVKPPVDAAIFRIAQEALTNVQKHAQTERVRLILTIEQDNLMLSIQDWGRGFDLSAFIDDVQHLGLVSMRERTELLGGTCTIESALGKGTHVKILIPITELAERIAHDRKG